MLSVHHSDVNVPSVSLPLIIVCESSFNFYLEQKVQVIDRYGLVKPEELSQKTKVFHFIFDSLFQNISEYFRPVVLIKLTAIISRLTLIFAID